MCFHWCSACGMLQTDVGRERSSNKMLPFLLLFFYSILSLCCCFFVSVYSLCPRRLGPLGASLSRPLVIFVLLLSARTG